MSDNLEEDLFQSLKLGSKQAFEQVYRQYFRMVESLVYKMGGTTEAAKDVFQETLMVFVGKLRDPEFILNSKISTFLYAVARNIYLKKARVSNRYQSLEQGTQEEKVADTGKEDKEEEDMAISLVLDKLKELEEDCREILLNSFYRNLSHEHIAKVMGYSLDYVKVKKFRCLQYLRKKVMDSSLYQQWNLE